MTNIFIAALLLGALVSAVWFWSRDNLRKKQSRDEAEDAREDADIANEPHKRGSNLLDRLFKRKN